MSKYKLLVIIVLTLFSGILLYAMKPVSNVETTKTEQIVMPDDVLIQFPDSFSRTYNDTLTVTLHYNGDSLLFSENEFELRGVKFKKNHPNYGYFQKLVRW